MTSFSVAIKDWNGLVKRVQDGFNVDKRGASSLLTDYFIKRKPPEAKEKSSQSIERNIPPPK